MTSGSNRTVSSVSNALSLDLSFRRADFALEAAGAFPARGVHAIIGPSGGGKTTLLRLIAGLERPQGGRLVVNGRTWVDVQKGVFLPARKRATGVVFQDYALFEHMTVAANIGYGVARRSRRAAVARWLTRLDLEGLAARLPGELSGGQRQRTALARALATNPDVLLLDEPLSAIDAHLRRRLRARLADVLGTMDIPVFMVSHDIDDVRALADWIGVMVAGRLVRAGRRDDVFDTPGEVEVARVLGWPNLLEVGVLAGDRIAGRWGGLAVEGEPPLDTAWIGFKPEHLHLHSRSGQGIAARVRAIAEEGLIRRVTLAVGGGGTLVAHRPADVPTPAPGSRVWLSVAPRHLRFMGEGRVLPGAASPTCETPRLGKTA
ncbi:ABC transporter ATP-binding protein [Varunaivibrio sulfuroxidans]|uniref:Molybdate transport system ATP-binding protein n=1 Tax=Varunaivibrio sulfuroxidans TaxID=1773489 RepID=A0A4R3JAS5_9PROT|nr:ABC transporter ATP-binding protein [Varunaivibrio sulfuroxidans]TCS61760.1 molybdate transport system ATP-binding protein [Varunaivibrio sulfuroxidans]WES32056.1 ABC transporter ATP-binding protein [Varunaivibrio sulfuroxidans]